MALSRLMTLECECGKAPKNWRIYSEYRWISKARWGKAQRVAAEVEFQAMVQSPCVWTSFEGFSPPTERSKPPMVVVVRSSASVENSPEKTASRLTTFPARTLFHSESGNPFCTEHHALGGLDVNKVVLDQFPGKLLTLREEKCICIIQQPRQKEICWGHTFW